MLEPGTPVLTGYWAREYARLQAEVERLQQANTMLAEEREAWKARADSFGVELTHRVGWEERCLDAEAALATLRAENARLRAASEQLASENAHMRVDRAAKDQEAVVAFHTIKRLRAIEQAAHAWATAVENSEDDGEESEEYVDAAHALYVALGRAKAS